MFSFYKKFIVVALIFALISSFLVPFFSTAVFAEDNSDFCNEVQNATCDSDLRAFSEDARLKNCSQTIQSGLLTLTNKCKEDLDKQKAQAESQLKTLEKQESAAERTLGNLNWNIKKLNTEIASLNLSLAELESAIQEREKAIKELDDALAKHKAILAEAIRQVYEYNTLSYIEIILGYGTLSDFNRKLEEIDKLQVSLKSSMEEISKAKQQMEQEKAELSKKKEQQEQYKTMQEMSKQSLATKQQQQQYLLEKLAVAKTPLEKEMARIEAELIELRSAMSKIQRYLSSWLGYKPNWSDIWKAVQSSSSTNGINPFVMLGVLEVESGFNTGAGYNAGSIEGNVQICINFKIKEYTGYRNSSKCGQWCGLSDTQIELKAIERCNEWNQSPNYGQGFRDICTQLGLDYNKMPISPTWAMGPSQFIAGTWRAYRCSSSANPWNLNDAVCAMGKKLKGGVANYNPGHSTYESIVMGAAKRWEEVSKSCGGLNNLDCSDLKSNLEKMGIPAQ